MLSLDHSLPLPLHCHVRCPLYTTGLGFASIWLIVWPCTVQVGYTDGTSHGQGWGFAAGFDDHILGTRLLPSTQIPGGSVTKTWTGVAILQVRGVRALDPLSHSASG
jgi:hypothetical protein